MARVAGRNLALSWFVGLLCVGIIAGLLWLSLPLVPFLAQFFGDALRTAFP